MGHLSLVEKWVPGIWTKIASWLFTLFAPIKIMAVGGMEVPQRVEMVLECTDPVGSNLCG